ncbi:hypothetical protein Pla163_15760 [Planctomycetes bacterium Pla163]|uniref:Saccharopine dehydrogenase n=1 Tax=Rohdeia mirabilis TaxID=2528008 RepID=A0A518CZ13_9BACT|nr:hypothetical protein Pla163_15760 [Planctomycetes bacterium Pla163]
MKIRIRSSNTLVGRAVLAAVQSEPDFDVVEQGADVVLDTGCVPAGIEAVTSALEAGEHWVDLCWQRAWAESIAELDAVAKEKGRAVVVSAGAFCGLTDPFVRSAADQMVRVNEVQLGLAVGSGSGLDSGSMGQFLAGRERTIRMLIGGEWSEREFYGDRRAFGFPPPVGDLFGGNADCADLFAFTQRPVRSASVRLTVAPPSGLAERGARTFLSWVRRGWIKSPEERPEKVMGWIDRLGGTKPSALAIAVRGIGSTRLPLEMRFGFVPPVERPEVLSVAPALETLRSLAADPVPGAGPCSGRVERTALSERLRRGGVEIVEGDLGGWRRPVPATS